MAAAWMARSLKTPDLLNSLELGGGYEIAQIIVPSRMVGKTLLEVALRDQYELNLITIGKSRGMSSSSHQAIQKVLGVPQPDRSFERDDVLVLFGKAQDVRRMMREHGG